MAYLTSNGKKYSKCGEFTVFDVKCRSCGDFERAVYFQPLNLKVTVAKKKEKIEGGVYE